MEELEGSRKVLECGSHRELGGPQREIQGPRTGWGDLIERETGSALSNVSPHCVGGMGWLEAVMGQREAAEERTAATARDF